MTIHGQWFIDDHWKCTVNDNMRSVIYVQSLIMYGKWHYTISDLLTMNDNVQEMTIYDQWFIYDHW
jgi:hypothetical protein